MVNKVKIANVEIKNNPSPFTENIVMDVTVDCIEQINADLELEVVYVGNSENAQGDQVLDSACVGPVKVGTNKFTLTAPPPNIQNIAAADLLDCTVLLLKVSYKNQLFTQVGYFVSNYYTDPQLQENPPAQPAVDKLMRNLNDTPRVTTFSIDWD
ncbi:hypothetical protein C9374_012446 [Naegleria lovaniensis]|uniref:Anti-silencing function protein 1 n=1 Tax=Naegleria lovaniensis TaxID=51637 RepID=A0AA88H1Y2_NAELO|nr:uncharacterized protein C9374_012446 [Naegleria lovaniensis]KAG2392194.1 hypothetical protein C9374_012446 [Naegleria lovaniensis]